MFFWVTTQREVIIIGRSRDKVGNLKLLLKTKKTKNLEAESKLCELFFGVLNSKSHVSTF
jgi:hypothetical protein